MSYTAAILPILSCLSLAQNTFQKKLPQSGWFARNSQQTLFLKNYYHQKGQLQKLLPEELRSCVGDVPLVNRFLKDNGFTIQLEDNQPNSELAVASILDIALTWKVPGEKCTLMPMGCPFENNQSWQIYPAVRMRSGITIRKTHKGKHILEVAAENGDIVYMTVAEKPLEGFELIESVNTLSTSPYENVTKQFSGALFPMVDLHTSVTLDWLIRLEYGYQDRRPYFIRQALQETRFQMNEKGAHAKSGVAIECAYRCIQEPKPAFEIDQPFYLWIERPGMNVPLFAAYIETADWKEPSEHHVARS